MAEYLLPFIILTLIAVILIQAVERYFYGKQMAELNNKITIALLSKDSVQYAVAVKTEKEPPKGIISEPDEIELSNASDDEFLKHIKRGEE